MKKSRVILLIIPLLFAFAIHNYHLSLTKIVVNKSNSLQVTMRFFIDDIETVINNTNQITSELNTDREFKSIDSLLEKHIAENFNINLNNKPLVLNYIGKEYEKDIIFFYLESDSISKINSLEIQNKILLSTFDDQQNIIKTDFNNQKNTLYLKNENDKEMLKFD